MDVDHAILAKNEPARVITGSVQVMFADLAQFPGLEHVAVLARQYAVAAPGHFRFIDDDAFIAAPRNDTEGYQQDSR